MENYETDVRNPLYSNTSLYLGDIALQRVSENIKSDNVLLITLADSIDVENRDITNYEEILSKTYKSVYGIITSTVLKLEKTLTGMGGEVYETEVSGVYGPNYIRGGKSENDFDNVFDPASLSFLPPSDFTAMTKFYEDIPNQLISTNDRFVKFSVDEFIENFRKYGGVNTSVLYKSFDDTEHENNVDGNDRQRILNQFQLFDHTTNLIGDLLTGTDRWCASLTTKTTTILREISKSRYVLHLETVAIQHFYKYPFKYLTNADKRLDRLKPITKFFDIELGVVYKDLEVGGFLEKTLKTYIWFDIFKSLIPETKRNKYLYMFKPIQVNRTHRNFYLGILIMYLYMTVNDIVENQQTLIEPKLKKN